MENNENVGANLQIRPRVNLKVHPYIFPIADILPSLVAGTFLSRATCSEQSRGKGRES